MNNYTLVITKQFNAGSHTNTLVGIERIRTDSIDKVVESFSGAITYVFEGHPVLYDATEIETNGFLAVKEYVYAKEN